jgi:hypothetical protein
MGSTVMKKLELAQMQMSAQAQWASDSLEQALGAAAHWQSVADGFKSDCAEAMQARAAVERYCGAAAIFKEIMTACQHAGHGADLLLGE